MTDDFYDDLTIQMISTISTMTDDFYDDFTIQATVLAEQPSGGNLPHVIRRVCVPVRGRGYIGDEEG